MSKLHPRLTTRDQPGTIRILVSGASGALGGELARQLAGPGVELSLWGRDQAWLDAVAGDCRHAGAVVTTRSLDLVDVAQATAALAEEDDAAPFDVALLAAGQGDTLRPGQVVEDPAQIVRLGLVNFVGPAALAAEIGARMARRGAGRIALVGSAAADHPLPFAAGYSGSKAGIARFADALRLALRPHGVQVTLVSPGFFGSGASQQATHQRPGEIAAALVAQRMIRAVAAGRAELVTPRRFAALRWIGAVLPRPLRDRVLLSLPSPQFD